MKSMTVRGIDQETAAKLRSVAKSQGKSINQVVLESIKASLGIGKNKKYTNSYDDLDFLFGKWSQEEFTFIQEKIEGERTIDQELWH